MIEIVRVALRRPYTFVVLALLLLIIGPLVALRTPTDIFPDIRIPVIAVVWQYTGLPPDEMSATVRNVFEAAACEISSGMQEYYPISIGAK
jgi:multidrug efflux pump subunit AcrB